MRRAWAVRWSFFESWALKTEVKRFATRIYLWTGRGKGP